LYLTPVDTTAVAGGGHDALPAPDPLTSYIALVDIANGLAARRPPDEWVFPNTDLTIHLHRQPRGHWVGLDTTAPFGPTGQGVTSTVLHDGSGPVGFAHQILTARPAMPR